jgi:VWFA-related protein
VSKLRWVLGLVVIVASPPLALAGAEGEYTIRSNPSEVRVFFTAADGGHTIGNLEPKDVAVIDNGNVIRRFRSFGRASEAPVHAVILIDASDSVAKQVASEFEVVRRFAQSSKWRTSDQLSIMSFGGPAVSTICKLTCLKEPTSLLRTAAGSTTPLYDALIAAVDLLEKSRNEESRSVIFLISDGSDNCSTHGFQDAIAAAHKVEVSVYTFNSHIDTGDGRGEGTLEAIAAETGGVARAMGKSAADVLSAALDNFREAFMLVYELPHFAFLRHDIEVVPALNPRLHFHSRRQYRNAGSASAVTDML